MKSEARTLKIHSNPEPISGNGQGLTQQDLKILRAAFPHNKLGVKVQTYNRERTRALLVLYLQHTDVQDRLEEVDPSWTMQVLREERLEENFYAHARLTVKGVSRENVGEGFDPKAAYSDALKRCAMLFGVGRYLYDASPVWVDYVEARDRYKQWGMEDYSKAQKADEIPSPATKTEASKSEEVTKTITPEKEKKQVRPREQLNRVLMNLYRPYLTRYPNTQFVELLGTRYGVKETRLMTVEQLENLVQYMEAQLRVAA